MNHHVELPIPQGNYIPAVRNADLVYTSGMTPRRSGELIYSGKVKALDPIETHREAVRLAAHNALIAAQGCLNEGEKIAIILQLNVFINAESDFVAHPKVADYASDFLIEKLGANSIGSRAAIGVASLPSDARIEITLIGKVI